MTVLAEKEAEKGTDLFTTVESPEIANAYLKRFSVSLNWFYTKRPKAQKPATANFLEPNDIPPGTQVSHTVFGLGIVERWVDQRVVRVVFDGGDSRMLVAKQAPLTVLTQ